MQNLKVGSTLQGGRYKKTDKETISDNDINVIKEAENKKKEEAQQPEKPKKKEKTPVLSLLIAVLVIVALFIELVSFNSCSVSGGDKSDTLSVKEDSAEIAIYTDDKTFNVGGVEFVMKHVEGGTFTMGATSEQQNPESEENPTHQVTLSSYYIGETEVTQALWTAVMGNTVDQISMANYWDTFGVGKDYPMYYISWDDCQEFISKLNSLTGQKFRLPTEAEWEYAARGGKKSKGYQYSGSNNLDDVAWYWKNSGDRYLSGTDADWDKIVNNNSKACPVKTKQPNELGIYDMSGNVWEWCQDWYDYYSSSSQTNPKGPSTGFDRVIRGGSWDNTAGCCRSAYRINSAPGGRGISFGLRLVLSE